MNQLPPDDRSCFEALSRQDTEQQMWEEHIKQVKELEKLMGEQDHISENFRRLFGGQHD